MVILDDGELVHGQPVVVARRVEVERPRLRAGDRAVLTAVFHRHAIHQQVLDSPVARLGSRSLGPRELAERLVERLGGKIRIQPVERAPQGARKHDITIGGAQGVASGGQCVLTRDNRVTQLTKPIEHSLFDNRLGEGGHGRPFLAALRTRYSRSVKPPSRSNAVACAASWRSRK